MGLLDDAIREHLELKRRHGADASEVQRQEEEIFGELQTPQAPEDAEAAEEPVAGPDSPSGDPPPAGDPPAVAEVPQAPAPVAAPAAAPDPESAPRPAPAPGGEPPHGDELRAGRFAEAEPWLDEPDEVPMEEALEHPRRSQPTTEFTPREVAEASGEPEYVAPDEEPAEDLLEETPDFLQETPEHDRLWFEQKPPRDFDFGS